MDGNDQVVCISFADDVVLVASTPRKLQRMYLELHARLAEFGLSLNLGKCSWSHNGVDDEEAVIVDRARCFLGELTDYLEEEGVRMESAALASAWHIEKGRAARRGVEQYVHKCGAHQTAGWKRSSANSSGGVQPGKEHYVEKKRFLAISLGVWGETFAYQHVFVAMPRSSGRARWWQQQRLRRDSRREWRSEHSVGWPS